MVTGGVKPTRTIVANVILNRKMTASRTVMMIGVVRLIWITAISVWKDIQEILPAFRTVIKNGEGKVVGYKWWLKGRDFSNFTTPALSDRVERAILSTLDRKVKASFDDIVQTIFIEFPNALTPDTQQIKETLQEYAVPTKDKKWMLKPDYQQQKRERVHSRMVYLLATLGKKAGFDVWIGTNEQRDYYKGRPLRELCDEIHVFKSVPQETTALERVKQIDVLWLDHGRIIYEFEVENTTGISEAIIRGSNISEDSGVKRFIIIPDDRENFLYKKLQEPILKETIRKIKWKFIRYSDLERFYKESKKAVDLIRFDNLAIVPKYRNSFQKNLTDYKG